MSKKFWAWWDQFESPWAPISILLAGAAVLALALILFAHAR